MSNVNVSFDNMRRLTGDSKQNVLLSFVFLLTLLYSSQKVVACFVFV